MSSLSKITQELLLLDPDVRKLVLSWERDLDSLADFILDEIDGEPSEAALENENAVATAKRVMFDMKDQIAKLKRACKLLCETPPVGAAYAVACQEAVELLGEME